MLSLHSISRQHSLQLKACYRVISMKNCFRRLDHLAWYSSMLVLASSHYPKGDICLSVLSTGIAGLKSYSFQENHWVRLKMSCSCPSQADENFPNASRYWKKNQNWRVLFVLPKYVLKKQVIRNASCQKLPCPHLFSCRRSYCSNCTVCVMLTGWVGTQYFLFPVCPCASETYFTAHYANSPENWVFPHMAVHPAEHYYSPWTHLICQNDSSQAALPHTMSFLVPLIK